MSHNMSGLAWELSRLWYEREGAQRRASKIIQHLLHWSLFFSNEKQKNLSQKSSV